MATVLSNVPAFYLHGDPRMVDYTPAANVTAGDVIVVNDTPKVAHHDIPANELGALAAEGAVYEMTVDVATPADKKVYWNNATNQVTTTAGALKVFGVTVTATTGATQRAQVRHDPSA